MIMSTWLKVEQANIINEVYIMMKLSGFELNDCQIHTARLQRIAPATKCNLVSLLIYIL